MNEYEILGEVCNLHELRAKLGQSEDDWTVTINSPGGSVFEGLQTVNAIRKAKGKVTAKIEVMAASIAAVIALACDKVTMRKSDLLMLHNCWTVAVGNKEELAQEIENMKAIDKVLHGIIAEHCKKPDELLASIDEGDVFLTGEDVAELFDNVELVAAPAKDGKQNCVDLASLIAGKREALDKCTALDKKVAELQEEVAAAKKPPYVVTAKVEKILAEEW